MKCNKCGSNMPDDSEFCMKCGTRLKKEYKCPSCGIEVSGDTVFCPNCGKRINKNKTFPIKLIVAALIVALAFIVGIIILFQSQTSPIKGVSKDVYDQGMEYLDDMKSTKMKEVTMGYTLEHMDVPMVEIYKVVDAVSYEVDVGKSPTEEEEQYAALIMKFWKSWATCYAYDSIILEYEDSDDKTMKMAVSMYKGMVSEFEESIVKAEDILRTADDISDLEQANMILDGIWTGD
ncbi:zinc ribbon domain-containing protein [Pseudobutyrivibrio sp.]|uniref:zinc ribbon domain-containing protein n=1 Tax=Pseudobutyrivibrio sp. TaxID=2014367 RepID=UPI0025D4725D|nr:zinc ribbon domain-containing protein [Pseudobutyrivibrio sp.]MBR5648840.1 zinc ribbon domain-containing protein [Pseudobutyrivibrio sp.]